MSKNDFPIIKKIHTEENDVFIGKKGETYELAYDCHYIVVCGMFLCRDEKRACEDGLFDCFFSSRASSFCDDKPICQQLSS